MMKRVTRHLHQTRSSDGLSRKKTTRTRTTIQMTIRPLAARMYSPVAQRLQGRALLAHAQEDYREHLRRAEARHSRHVRAVDRLRREHHRVRSPGHLQDRRVQEFLHPRRLLCLVPPGLCLAAHRVRVACHSQADRAGCHHQGLHAHLYPQHPRHLSLHLQDQGLLRLSRLRYRQHPLPSAAPQPRRRSSPARQRGLRRTGSCPKPKICWSQFRRSQ
jgi:hypothetical protein